MAASEEVQRARRILGGGETGTVSELLSLAKDLARQFAYRHARMIARLGRQTAAPDPVSRFWLLQVEVLATYKDYELAPEVSLPHSLALLSTAEPATTEQVQERHGITGGVHKRLWETDGNAAHLEDALISYRSGYESGVEQDLGYNGINAAFVLDALAGIEVLATPEGEPVPETAERRRAEAIAIRRVLIEELAAIANRMPSANLANRWWFAATMAEANLGLSRNEQAADWLSRAARDPRAEGWQLESTAQQLLLLIYWQGTRPSRPYDVSAAPAWFLVAAAFKRDLRSVRSALTGRVGLALSGGGFRASFYHLGVLAFLAERDVLSSVEVMSCVSGGSILGAHVYLEVKKLLESKADREITRVDYVELVERVIVQFLKGVESNIRTRLFANWFANLKALILPSYSRTHFLGECLERYLYSRVIDGNESAPRYLSGLFIRPMDGPMHFWPRRDNWGRAAKVPVLVLNATTLNTGHVWQFTAASMGEPPGAIDTEVDSNDRLRRVYYEDAPATHQRVRLGQAVAASACVPGLFDPLVLTGLYEGKDVALVDGGVHDNQGTATLLEQNCKVLLVSDASGQMSSLQAPNAEMLAVATRSNDILMARVRGAQYRLLKARMDASTIRSLLFVHLRQDLPSRSQDWMGCADPGEGAVQEHGGNATLTKHGERIDLLGAISAIRTDLDSFSEVEAYALMLRGYETAAIRFDDCVSGFPADPAFARHPWNFLALESILCEKDESSEALKRLSRHLRTASSRAFKAAYLSRFVAWVACILLALGLWILWLNKAGVAPYIGLTISAAILVGLSVRVLLNKTFTQIVTSLAVIGGGSFAAYAYLQILNPIYLRMGRLTKIIK